MVYGPFRPARPSCWRTGDFAAVELGGAGYLELLAPFVYIGLAHRERLIRCRCLAVRDPGELDVLVHRQGGHLAGRPGRPRKPAQRRPFIAAPEPEVEHDAGPQPQRLQGNRDEPPFEHPPLTTWPLEVTNGIAEQRDLPVIRGQPHRLVPRGDFFGPGG